MREYQVAKSSYATFDAINGWVLLDTEKGGRVVQHDFTPEFEVMYRVLHSFYSWVA